MSISTAAGDACTADLDLDEQLVSPSHAISQNFHSSVLLNSPSTFATADFQPQSPHFDEVFDVDKLLTSLTQSVEGEGNVDEAELSTDYISTLEYEECCNDSVHEEEKQMEVITKAPSVIVSRQSTATASRRTSSIHEFGPLISPSHRLSTKQDTSAVLSPSSSPVNQDGRSRGASTTQQPEQFSDTAVRLKLLQQESASELLEDRLEAVQNEANTYHHKYNKLKSYTEKLQSSYDALQQSLTHCTSLLQQYKDNADAAQQENAELKQRLADSASTLTSACTSPTTGSEYSHTMQKDEYQQRRHSRRPSLTNSVASTVMSSGSDNLLSMSLPSCQRTESTVSSQSVNTHISEYQPLASLDTATTQQLHDEIHHLLKYKLLYAEVMTAIEDERMRFAVEHELRLKNEGKLMETEDRVHDLEVANLQLQDTVNQLATQVSIMSKSAATCVSPLSRQSSQMSERLSSPVQFDSMRSSSDRKSKGWLPTWTKTRQSSSKQPVLTEDSMY